MGVDPYADVQQVPVSDLLRRSREFLNSAEHLGRRFVIMRLGRPSVLMGPAPRDLRLTPAARRDRPPPEPVDLTPMERDVLQAISDRELHPFMNRLGREGISSAGEALGGMELEGLINRSPTGKYTITDAGRAALASAPAAAARDGN